MAAKKSKQNEPRKPAHPAAVAHHHFDRGADGSAALSRPAGWHSPKARARTATAHEQVQCVRYRDAALWDRLRDAGQISDRQHAAAERLAERWTAAGLNPRLSANVRAVSSSSEYDDDEPEPEACSDPDETARDRYRRLMLCIPGAFVVRLEAMLLGEHPTARGLETLQNGLSWLADHWKLADEAPSSWGGWDGGQG